MSLITESEKLRECFRKGDLIRIDLMLKLPGGMLNSHEIEMLKRFKKAASLMENRMQEEREG